MTRANFATLTILMAACAIWLPGCSQPGPGQVQSGVSHLSIVAVWHPFEQAIRIQMWGQSIGHQDAQSVALGDLTPHLEFDVPPRYGAQYAPQDAFPVPRLFDLPCDSRLEEVQVDVWVNGRSDAVPGAGTDS